MIFKKTLASLALLFTLNAHAQNYLESAGLSPTTQYKTFETTHFTIIYQDGYLDFAKKAATHFEHAHTILSPLLKWQPRQKTSVLIADNEDSANGFAAAALRIGIVLIATPPDAWSSLSYSDDWIKLLAFHEYTHILNIDPTRTWIEFFRKYIFGDVVRPNSLWPRWMLEGLAVYYETRTSRMGRGRSPYYDSVLRAFLNEGRLDTDKNFGLTLDRINGDFPYFPGGEIAYLFGYHLWNQFSKSSNEELMGEYSYRSAGRVPFFIEGNLENITGKNWKDYWSAFVKESQTRLGSQLQKINAAKITPYTKITNAGYSALGGAVSPDGKWMAYTQLTQERRQGLYLRNLETGAEKNLEKWIDDKYSGTGMSFTPDSRYLIYSALVKHKTFYLYSDLFSYDLQKNKVRQFTEGLRAKEPALSPDGKKIVYIQVEKAGHQLVTADLNLEDEKFSLKNPMRVFNALPFAMIGNPKFLDNNTVAWSQQNLGQGYSDLLKSTLGSKQVSVLYHDNKMNRFPIVQDKNIIFISDQDRVENIYRLNPATKKLSRVTNVLTGTSLPFVGPKGELYASLMTSNGYEIVRFDSQESPVSSAFTEPSAPQSLTPALESPELKFNSNPEDYSPAGSLLPRAWSPFAYATNGTYSGTTIGGIVSGFDTSGKHQYALLGAYNLKPKTPDGTLSYTYFGFRPAISLDASAKTTDIGTDSSHLLYRREFETQLSLAFPVAWTFSSLRPRIYGFIDWNGVHNISTGQRYASSDFEYNNRMVPGYGASLLFKDTQSSKLAFMPERGTSLYAALENHINLGRYSAWKYLVSATHYFKIGEHSVLQPTGRWLGTSRMTGTEWGYSLLEGKRTNDLSDRGSQSSLKRLGIRGYSNMTIIPATSHGVGVGSLDYYFPIDKIFRGPHDTFPAFFKQVHGFVFGETAYIPTTRVGPFYLPSFGAGITLDTTVLTWVPASFTFEMQNGTRKDLGGDQLFFLTISSDLLGYISGNIPGERE